jgi:stearoyl-CoA desaturase (delta-9 desaturase)
MESWNLAEETLRPSPVCEMFRAKALLRPIGVVGRPIHWRYVSAVGSYHLLALLALLPWYYSRTGVVLAVVGVFVFGSIGINLCYHRLLSHRSFSCPLWLEHLFAIIAVCSLEDTPARWVATHRQHHHRADEQADPHSPMVNLFWAYMGWLFVENVDLVRPRNYDRYVRDIIRDPFYRWIERYYVWIVLAQSPLFFAVGFLAAIALGETGGQAAQFGASLWLWGVVIRTIAVWHITWCGNSFPHLFGYRNYQTNDNSRNNAWVAIITNGEGWHNNHHADPSSASNQRHWWEMDLTFYFLRGLALLGLAWDIKLPRKNPLV